MPAYKNPIRHSWYCSFHFTDWQGINRRKKKEGFKTRREALDFERKFLEQHAGKPDISFAALVKAYKKNQLNNCRPHTCYTKNSIISHHILPFFANFSVASISRQQILAWKKSLTEQNLRPSYLRLIYAQLKSIFTFAVEHYKLPQNPCPTRDNCGKAKKVVRYLTVAEFQKFAMTLTQPRHIMAFYLLFWTGMRSGELLALGWDDIDFATGTITISKSYVRLNRQDILTTGKTDSSRREVIMPAFLTAMLEDYQKISKDSERIFSCTRNMLYFALKKGLSQAQLKDIRLHDLRHSHASLLINAGFRPIDVADRLGHANAGITLAIYSHFYDSKRASLAERLNHIY